MITYHACLNVYKWRQDAGTSLFGNNITLDVISIEIITIHVCNIPMLILTYQHVNSTIRRSNDPVVMNSLVLPRRFVYFHNSNRSLISAVCENLEIASWN